MKRFQRFQIVSAPDSVKFNGLNQRSNRGFRELLLQIIVNSAALHKSEVKKSRAKDNCAGYSPESGQRKRPASRLAI